MKAKRKSNYEVSYLVYQDNQSHPEFGIFGGYDSIDELKSYTAEILQCMVENMNIEKGTAYADMYIDHDGEYVDSDMAELTIRDGKIVSIDFD